MEKEGTGNQTRTVKVELLRGTHTRRKGEERRAVEKFRKGDIFFISPHEQEAFAPGRIRVIKDTPVPEQVMTTPLDLYRIVNVKDEEGKSTTLWAVKNIETGQLLSDPMSRVEATSHLAALIGETPKTEEAEGAQGASQR